jgi:bacterioferritin-associated ferredoxin
MPAMIVCVCHRVSEHSITRAARAGMSFDDIQLELGVATQCGQCESGARALVSECCGTAPVAHIKLDSLRQNLSALASTPALGL